MSRGGAWRSVVISLVVVMVASSLTASQESGQPVRLLTIGNSFAENALRYLPQFAHAAGHELQIVEANLPGHSLEQHWRYLATSESDPGSSLARAYKGSNGEAASRSLPEILACEPWDIITLQQVSHLSHKLESFHPYVNQLVGYLREHAPEAKILLHQTWAYREDHPIYRNGFSSEAMATQIEKNYRILADSLQVGVLPVGEAFRAVRQTENWKFSYPDPDFDYDHPKRGSIPRQPGSLHRGWAWRKNKTTGADEFHLDAIHANVAGCYLAGAVWFEVIFQADVTENSFRPAELSVSQAAFLRRVAHRTVEVVAAGRTHPDEANPLPGVRP